MNIIKLSAIDSTNSYLKLLVKQGKAVDALIVTTKNQTKGRGQQGASWQFQEGNSLAFSVLKHLEGMRVDRQFELAMAVSLAVKKALKKLGVPNIKIKWPNDILSDNKKLCGILVENIVQGSFIKKTIVGVGLNVNEIKFQELPRATSMRLNSGIIFDLDTVLTEVTSALIETLNSFDNDKHSSLRERYESNLFRKDLKSEFIDATNNRFFGTIKGISTSGKLRVLTEDNEERHFGFKEVSLQY